MSSSLKGLGLTSAVPDFGLFWCVSQCESSPKGTAHEKAGVWMARWWS
jgi:hypothetical protein